MTFRPAYDVPLVYGGNTVWLRPSLQAAMRLEALHGGFPALLTKIQQHDTATLRTIITYAATDQDAAQTLLKHMAGKSLRSIQSATLGPMIALITVLMMPTPEAEPTSTTTKPVKWADLYADLFKMATGWLGWTPDTAWNASLPDILHAFDGHTDQLKAIHGSADDDADQPATSAEQHQNIIDQGFDPEFDRAGLRALKSL